MAFGQGACSQEADLRALSSVLSPAPGRRHMPATPSTRVRSQHLSLTLTLPMPKAAPEVAASTDEDILKRQANPKFPAKSRGGLIGAEAEHLISQMKGTLPAAQSRADSHPAHSGHAELIFFCSSSTVRHVRKSPGLLPAHTLCNI